MQPQACARLEEECDVRAVEAQALDGIEPRHEIAAALFHICREEGAPEGRFGVGRTSVEGGETVGIEDRVARSVCRCKGELIGSIASSPTEALALGMSVDEDAPISSGDHACKRPCCCGSIAHAHHLGKLVRERGWIQEAPLA
jgi:hypothetical protein